MKSAALHFAKHCPGWPRDAKDVGLYVNIFGHNNVNSLFIHILDLTVTGPSFAASRLTEVTKTGACLAASHFASACRDRQPFVKPAQSTPPSKPKPLKLVHHFGSSRPWGERQICS